MPASMPSGARLTLEVERASNFNARFPAAEAGEPDEDGVVIRPSERVYLCPYVVHRNSCYRPQPDRFRPERFAAGASNGRPRYAYR
jgi:cytochrome P450